MLGIRFVRLNRGLSQTTLARLVGLRQTDISLLELGRLRLSPDELQKLAQVLGIASPSLLLQELPDLDEVPVPQHEAHAVTR